MSIRVFNRFKKKYFSYNSDVGVLGKSVCVRCDAMLFDGETKTGICCSNGKIKLRPLHSPTREIVDMYSGTVKKYKSVKRLNEWRQNENSTIDG